MKNYEIRQKISQGDSTEIGSSAFSKLSPKNFLSE